MATETAIRAQPHRPSAGTGPRRRPGAGAYSWLPVLAEAIGSLRAKTFRWLRAEVSDVVAIEPARGAAQPATRADRGDLSGGLARWRRRVERRRAIVLLRRNLVLGLALAIAVEIVLVLAGERRLSPWLLAPAALALLAAAAGLTARSSLAQTARMLDDGLGLSNRVETALELATTNGGRRTARAATTGAAVQAGVLEALVSSESAAAVAESFHSAHLVRRGSKAEWRWLAGLAVVLALLVALPGIRLHSPGSHARGASTHLSSSAGHGGALVTHSSHPKRPAPLPVGAADDNLPQPPLAIAPNATEGKAGKGGGSIYGHGGILSAKELASAGLSSPNVGTKVIAAPGAAGGSGSTSRTVSTSGKGSASASGSSSAGKSSSAGGLSAPSASSPGATRAGGTGGSTPGHSGAAAGSGSGKSSARSGAAPPGGEEAGGVRGSSTLTAGLVPDLPQGSAGLPLQAGYAPSTSKGSNSEGSSQTPNGGGGAGRTAHTTDGGSGSASGLAVIAPTPNSTSAADQGLLNNYFGASDQLSLTGW